jgi:hypothetical protein
MLTVDMLEDKQLNPIRRYGQTELLDEAVSTITQLQHFALLLLNTLPTLHQNILSHRKTANEPLDLLPRRTRPLI